MASRSDIVQERRVTVLEEHVACLESAIQDLRDLIASNQVNQTEDVESLALTVNDHLDDHCMLVDQVTDEIDRIDGELLSLRERLDGDPNADGEDVH